MLVQLCLKREGESLPRSHINVWNPFVRCELKIYAVSLPWSHTVACRSGPLRPRSKRQLKIKHGGVEMGVFLLVCSHSLHWHIRLYDVFSKSTLVLRERMNHHVTKVYHICLRLVGVLQRGRDRANTEKCSTREVSFILEKILLTQTAVVQDNFTSRALLACHCWTLTGELNCVNLRCWSEICIFLKAQIAVLKL